MEKKKNRFMQSALSFIMLTLLITLISACSGAANESAQKSGSAAADMDTGNMAYATDSNALTVFSAEEKLKASSDDKQSAPALESGGAAPIVITGGEGFNRKLIYRADLTMEVKDFGKAAAELRNMIHQSGGYMTQFSDSRSDYEVSANFTIKVPAGGFTSFIEKLGQMEHTRFQQQISGSDVTEEYVDLDSRLKAKQVVEARLLDFMDKASKADDLVRFSNQLAEVQEEIERIKGRMRYLDDNVAYSTIELRLYQPSERMVKVLAVGRPLGSRMTDALSASVQTMFTVFEALLVFAAGALPVLIVLAIIGAPVYLWMRRRSRALPRTALLPPAEEGQDEEQNR
ncbi:DUF4349 domain-containing protein [Paenibacillus tarimensis]